MAVLEIFSILTGIFMPLVVHIGLHKTGTSAIQEHLAGDRMSMEKTGFHYPLPLCPYPSHGELAWCFLGSDAPWKDRDYSVEEVFSHYESVFTEDSSKTAIISSEDFSLLPHMGRKFQQFSSFLTKFDPIIAVYVRNPYDYLVSAYHHAVRERHITSTFEDYLAFSFFDRAIDYEARISRWADVFGSEAIVLREYAPADAVGDFYNLLNLPRPENLEDKKPVNIGIHPWLGSAYRSAPSTSSGDYCREQLLELSVSLPRVNSLEFYLGHEWENILRARIGLDYSALLARYPRRSIAG